MPTAAERREPAGPRPPGGTGATAVLEWAVALAVAALVLGPALAPGHLLRYDLVSVPGPALGPDAVGLGDRLPRAVPWDAVVAVLARGLPDAWVVQALALLGLTAAGAGAARLARPSGAGRWVALLVAGWNPFVAEQLGIGHVPHLVGYGMLPWVALLAHRAVRGPGAGRALRAGAVAAVGSVTPGGGVLCLLVATAAAVAAVWRRDAAAAGLRAAGVVALAVVVQLPWVLAGAFHPAHGRTDPASATLFAVRAETPFGPFVDALALGGLWNAAAVPTSRRTALASVGVVLLLGLAAAGLRPVLRCTPRPQAVAAVAVSAGCYLVAVLGVLPGGGRVLAVLAADVPGGGLLRDGHRWLAAPALGLAVLAGAGAQRAATAVSSRGGVRATGLPAAVLVLAGCGVVAVLPDGGWGLGGELRPVRVPAAWEQVPARLAATGDGSRVLVLPWQPFRRFAWSGPAPVLDPLPRMLDRQVLVSDRLRVGDVVLAPEGPAAVRAEAALGDGRLDAAEARALRVGWVLVERGTPGEVPALPPGTTVLDDPDLLLLRLRELPAAPAAGAARTAAVAVGHGAWLLVLLLGAGAAVTTLRDRTVRRSAATSGHP